MFYQFGIKIEEKSPEEIAPGNLTAGYIGREELSGVCKMFGFAESTAQRCQSVHFHFRSDVEIYRDYTFTELRIADPSHTEAEDDCVALYIKKDLFLVVDVLDADRSTYQKFMRAVERFAPKDMTLEKLIYAFTDELLSKDVGFIEKIGMQVSEMEESILNEEPDSDFSQTLLKLKKKLQRMHNYYEQFLDIFETIEANENDIFKTDTLMYISNLNKRVTRLREDVDSLNSGIVHVQDAYSSHLDMKMNKTMKYLTVLTTLFFPLTIIVGWYGMNFQYMPEFGWRFGYLYVILLSAAVISLFILIAKKKKWF